MKYRTTKFIFSMALAHVLAFFTAQSLQAKDYGATINLAGKQRMLTQKMSKEIFLAAANENAPENLKAASNTAALFDKTLNGLIKGDPELGLSATESARIVRQLTKVAKLWTPFKETVDKVVAAGTVTEADITVIADINLPLLKEMNKAVKLYEKEASQSGDATAGGLAVTINLAGKQRMLTQKMSKEYLLVALKHDEDTNKLKLMETASLFDRTLKGLKEGDEVLELVASHNTPEVTTQLAAVGGLWEQFKPLVEKAAAEGSGSITPESIHSVAEKNLPLLVAMNKAVGIYQAISQK